MLPPPAGPPWVCALIIPADGQLRGLGHACYCSKFSESSWWPHASLTGEAGRVRNKPEVQGANPGDQRSNEHRVKQDGEWWWSCAVHGSSFWGQRGDNSNLMWTHSKWAIECTVAGVGESDKTCSFVPVHWHVRGAESPRLCPYPLWN